MNTSLLPAPKSRTFENGFFSLKNCTITVDYCTDYRIVKAALSLKNEISKTTGLPHSFKQANALKEGCIFIALDQSLGKEAYTITVTQKGITLLGGDNAGCFYGIQTLKQLICEENIPAQTITDSPDMKHRGFYYDTTRGRISTLSHLKKIVDKLASLKYNSLQLYVEHSFDFLEFRDGVRTEEDFLTPEELLELDSYCYDNFIDFIPSLSTFGHLYELLSKKEYAHLCELENYEPSVHFWLERMMHHTIDATKEESLELVCSLIDQYLPLFRSKYFNICCDETFDLAQGRNKGCQASELYIDFVGKISKHIKASGKTVMMWADVALNYPDKLSSLPDDTILLNWDYEEQPNEDHAKTIKELNRTQILCPGVTSWYRFLEDINMAQPNICNTADLIYKYDAQGMLLTCWGDFGHPAPFGSSLYGTLMSACVCWNKNTVFDNEYQLAASKLLYNCDENIVPTLIELSLSQRQGGWYYFSSQRHNIELEPLKKEELEKALAASEKAVEVFSAQLAKGAKLEELLVSAEGVALFQKTALLKLNDSDTSSLKTAFEQYSKKYADLWLKDTKRSELDTILEFFNYVQ